MGDLQLNQIMGGTGWGSIFIAGVGMVSAWLIDAAGLLGHHIAGYGVGTGPGSAANLAEFAGAALAVELIGIAQLHEDGRLLVDVRERVVMEVAAFDGKKS